MPATWSLPLLVLVSFAAGVQNVLAGGGSFMTFPALLFAGLDPRAANIASTIALFPGQVTTGLAGRKHVAGAEGVSFRALFWISLAGGAAGAVLLLVTPVSVFTRLVPFLVLFATDESRTTKTPPTPGVESERAACGPRAATSAITRSEADVRRRLASCLNL